MAPNRRPARAGSSKRPQLTHFLCLPLVNGASRLELASSLASFREDVAEELPSKAIRPVGTLHCALGVMSLTRSKLDTTIKILNDLDISAMLRGGNKDYDEASSEQSSTTNRPLQIQLKGLQSMHEAHNTSILYAAPKDSGDRLLSFCLMVQKIFRESGLLAPDDRPLRLHATIVNTIYAKRSMTKSANTTQSKITPIDSDSSRNAGIPKPSDGSTGHGPNAKGSMKFDARDLLDRYKDHIWAETITLDRLAICEMGAKKHYDADGKLIGEEYKEVAHVLIST